MYNVVQKLLWYDTWVLIYILGIKAALASKPDLKVELIVFGTPAEEGGGGKVKMIEKGVFDETDFCMMSHPSQYEVPHPVCLALLQLTVVFHGKR